MSSIRALLGTLLGRPPRLICSQSVWCAGVKELHRRTDGEQRESGAWLLGDKLNGTRIIRKFVYYDDIDPEALDTGIVVINGVKLGALWALCRELDLEPVADVHVHPYGYQQSRSDQDNPMMTGAGHLALILPNFARGAPRPGSIGMFEHLGARKWRNHSAAGANFFHVGWWPWM